MLYDDLVHPGEYICHHGVKGMKWGVRHDPEKKGRTSKIKNFVLGKPEAWKAYDNSKLLKMTNKKFEQMLKNMSIEEKSQLLKDCDLLTEKNYWDQLRKKIPEDKIFSGRLKKAADTGLKALAKMGRDSYDSKKGITNDDRFWFVCEDQTIGLTTIADLVNRNFSRDTILSLVNVGREVNRELGLNAPEGAFHLAEVSHDDGKWLDGFIDGCIRNRSPYLTQNDIANNAAQEALRLHNQAHQQFMDQVNTNNMIQQQMLINNHMMGF